MKRLWAAGAILFLLLSAALWSSWYAGRFTEQAARQLEQAQQLAGQDQWDRADRITESVFRQWQEHSFYFHAVMRHQDTDEILRAFYQVRQSIALREPDQYSAANSDLAVQLRLLGESESVSLENIF